MRLSLRALLVIGALLAAAPLFAQAAKRLSEADLAKLIELQIDDDVIVAKIRKGGVAFSADDALLERLRKAGASAKVVEALRPAGRPAEAAAIVTFNDLLAAIAQEVSEDEILKALAASPTRFTLSQQQRAKLEALGASKRVIDAAQAKRVQAASPGSDVTDLAIILDCSGSMKERTPDGETKMEAAKRVLARLIPAIPDGLGVTFILYGNDARRKCEAVEVVRPLKPFDELGKQQLLDLVATLGPVGSTPIALALRTAGVELTRSEGLSEIVLVTDGMETCNGRPADEAASLVARLHLKSVEVIGMGVNNGERAGLEAIAKAGKGHFFNARNAQDVAAALEKTLPVERIEAPATPVINRVGRASGVLVTPLNLRGFPPITRVFLMKAGVSHVMGPFQSTEKLGSPMLVPAGSYDLYYKPGGGNNLPILAVAKLEVSANQVVTVRSDQVVSAILLKDPGIGVPIRKVAVRRLGEKFNDVQSVYDGVDKPLLVAAGQEYDVCVKAEGGQESPVAERVRPRAGELLVIGGGDNDNPGKGASASSPATDGDPEPARVANVANGSAEPPARRAVKPSDAAAGPEIEALIADLTNRDPAVRARAAETLGEMGQAARSAVPALIRRVSDRQGTRVGARIILADHSRNAALGALNKLAPDRVEGALLLANQVNDISLRLWSAKLLNLVRQQSGSTRGEGTEPAPSSPSAPKGLKGLKPMAPVRQMK